MFVVCTAQSAYYIHHVVMSVLCPLPVCKLSCTRVAYILRARKYSSTSSFIRKKNRRRQGHKPQDIHDHICHGAFRRAQELVPAHRVGSPIQIRLYNYNPHYMPLPPPPSVRRLALSAAASAVRAAQDAENGSGRNRATVHPTAAATAASVLETVAQTIRKLTVLLVVSSTILALSVLSYGAVYHISMPKVDVRRSVHFDYAFAPDRHRSGAYGRHLDRCEAFAGREKLGLKEEGAGTWDGNCVHTSYPSDRGGDYEEAEREGWEAEEPPPTAVVDLRMSHTQWHAYADDVLPELSSLRRPDRVLKPGRRYYVSLSLNLPESEVNRDLGIFMVEVDLLSADGSRLARSGRPTALPHESAAVGLVRRMVLIGPILLGAVREARTVLVEPFDSYVDSPSRSLASIVVRAIVPPSVARSVAHSPLQIYGGEIRIGRELNDVQRFMKDWFYTCGSIAVAAFSVIYTIWFVILRAWFRRRRRMWEWSRQRAENMEDEAIPPHGPGGVRWDHQDRGHRDEDDDDWLPGYEEVPEDQFEDMDGDEDSEMWRDLDDQSDEVETDQPAFNGRSGHQSGEAFTPSAVRDQNTPGQAADSPAGVAAAISAPVAPSVSEDANEGVTGNDPDNADNITMNRAKNKNKKKKKWKKKRKQELRRQQLQQQQQQEEQGQQGQQHHHGGRTNNQPSVYQRGIRTSDAREASQDEQNLAERVMRGEYGSTFEIFTDLDDPEPDLGI